MMIISLPDYSNSIGWIIVSEFCVLEGGRTVWENYFTTCSHIH
jgi:hypothetical protein